MNKSTMTSKIQNIWESLWMRDGIKPWWYPKKMGPVVCLGMVLGLLPRNRDGYWSFCVAYITGSICLLILTVFWVIFFVFMEVCINGEQSDVKSLCENSACIALGVTAFHNMIWFWSHSRTVRSFLVKCKELEVWQKVGRNIGYCPLLLLLLTSFDSLLPALWFIGDLTFCTSPFWTKVCILPCYWFLRVTAVFPILLYIAVAGFLKDYAAYLGTRIEITARLVDTVKEGARAMPMGTFGRGGTLDSRRIELARATRKKSVEDQDNLDDALDEVIREWRHLSDLHDRLAKVLSMPLLCASAYQTVMVIVGAFFLTDATTLLKILTCVLMMVTAITLLYVQGYAADSFLQQTLYFHQAVRQMQITLLSPRVNLADSSLIEQVLQLIDDAGNPLEMNMCGLFILSCSNFLPTVGAIASNLVVLQQFYLPKSNQQDSL
ncbi:uncharacterized protein [Procambarus clarkii]|uniref:uncharacterized protein n=1 Tax=Procambarus clarkii TaxID=6728 RepID=UPI001E6713D9|nr:uncharacterized protein LOC123771078 [Procambarus clarkii]